MKKLNKKQADTKAEHVTELDQKRQDLENAIGEYNQTQKEAFEKVQAALDAYNNSVDQAREFVDDIKSEMQSYYDERSEKWQEGDAGSNYQSWIDAWENIDLSEIEVSEPDELDLPDMEHYTELDNLQNEVDQ